MRALFSKAFLKDARVILFLASSTTSFRNPDIYGFIRAFGFYSGLGSTNWVRSTLICIPHDTVSLTQSVVWKLHIFNTQADLALLHSQAASPWITAQEENTSLTLSNVGASQKWQASLSESNCPGNLLPLAADSILSALFSFCLRANCVNSRQVFFFLDFWGPEFVLHCGYKKEAKSLFTGTHFNIPFQKASGLSIHLNNNKNK